ncbi:MAG: Crp/Fnr family transcriptional regulator [Ignavibacteria bacterium]|jgi:CRP-like cAMP-binding protein
MIIKLFQKSLQKLIETIEKLFIKKELKKYECFLKGGEVCRNFAFVEQGLLRHCINDDGKEKIFYFSAENDFICDYESFIDKVISKKTIEAIEDTIIYSISYDNMQQFYAKVSFGDRFGHLFIEGVFTKAVKHIISLHTDNAEQRYLNFLHLYKHIQQRLPQYYIASFIGVTPQSLSRIRRKLAGK